jgi:hypothetical protein
MIQKRVKKNYINNKDLYQALIQYQKDCRDAEDSGDEKPMVPRYIGESIFQIANRLSTKPNFSGYSFKEDMIMDGIENCLQYMHNFNPEKTENPFAYFTQIIWYAFLRRIAKEKKQMYIRYKSSQSMISMGETYEGGSELALNLNTSADYINNFIEDYEIKLNKGKKQKEIDEAKDVTDNN